MTTRTQWFRVMMLAGGALLWVFTLVVLALPWLLWRGSVPSSTASPAIATPTGQRTDPWHYSVLDRAQRPEDRLPTWVQKQNPHITDDLNSTRRLAILPGGGGVYLSGTQSTGCIITIDTESQSAGWVCGARPDNPTGLVSGSSLTAEPCGIVVILTPDGYTDIDQLNTPAPIVARGTNAIVLVDTGAHPISLEGDTSDPLHIDLPSPATRPNNVVGC